MLTRKSILEFYKSEALINPSILETYLHPDFILEWTGSDGLIKMNKQEWINYTKELEKAYVRFKARISHILVDKNLVSVKYSLSVKTIENPREEIYLTDFMVIWEIKEDKLYRCYQMSRSINKI
jgi:hypothetical protein